MKSSMVLRKDRSLSSLLDISSRNDSEIQNKDLKDTKEKLINIVNYLFDMMGQKKFDTLEKHMTHPQEIIKSVANFSLEHQKLYILLLAYKSSLGGLEEKEEADFIRYKEKYAA